jgi:hypothetical protein
MTIPIDFETSELVETFDPRVGESESSLDGKD